jgi:hypothetical protein
LTAITGSPGLLDKIDATIAAALSGKSIPSPRDRVLMRHLAASALLNSISNFRRIAVINSGLR